MVSKEVRDIVRRFAASIAERGIQVDKVLLYGSYAANRQGANSDLDVAIVSPDFGRDRIGEGMLLNRLAWRVDARLHPVPLSSSAFKDDTWVPLIHEVRSTGIEIQ